MVLAGYTSVIRVTSIQVGRSKSSMWEKLPKFSTPQPWQRNSEKLSMTQHPHERRSRITCRFCHTFSPLNFTIGLKDLPSMDVDLSLYEMKGLNLGGKSSSCNGSSLALVRSGGSRHTATKPNVVCHSLDQLPIGILHKVINHLDLVALVSLKSSNRHFYTTISIDKSLLSVCIRWRIHIHFWNDSRIQRLGKACMLCKTKRKHRTIRDRDERFILVGPSRPCSEGHRKDPMLIEKISHNDLARNQWDNDNKWVPTEWTLMDSTTTLFYKIPQPPKSLVENYVSYTVAGDELHCLPGGSRIYGRNGLLIYMRANT